MDRDPFYRKVLLLQFIHTLIGTLPGTFPFSMGASPWEFFFYLLTLVYTILYNLQQTTPACLESPREWPEIDWGESQGMA